MKIWKYYCLKMAFISSMELWDRWKTFWLNKLKYVMTMWCTCSSKTFDQHWMLSKGWPVINTTEHICPYLHNNRSNIQKLRCSKPIKNICSTVLVPPLKTRTRIKREQRAAADQEHSLLFNLKSCDSDRWKAEALPVSRIHVKIHVVFGCLHFTPATAKHNHICFILCIN